MMIAIISGVLWFIRLDELLQYFMFMILGLKVRLIRRTSWLLPVIVAYILQRFLLINEYSTEISIQCINSAIIIIPIIWTCVVYYINWKYDDCDKEGDLTE